MKKTKLEIQMELDGSVADVLDAPGITQWLGQMWLMCQIQEIPVKMWLNGDPLDISLLEIRTPGEKPS